MSVLVIISLYAMSMSIRSQGVSLQVRKAQATESCENYARMALEEAVYRLRSHAADPGHPVFDLLRKEGAGEELHFKPEDLPRTREEMARTPKFSFDGVDVETLRWAPIAEDVGEAVGYEAVGVLRVSTRVIGPKGASSYQEAEYGYRTSLTSAPRPFDTFTFRLSKTELLLSEGAFRGDANETIRWAATMLGRAEGELKAAQGNLQRALDDAQDKLSNLSVLASSSDRRKLQDAISGLGAILQSLQALLAPSHWPATPPWTVLPGGGDSLGKKNTLHEFFSPLAVHSFADRLDLTALDLPSQITPLVQDVLGRESLRKGAAAALQAAQGSGNPLALVASFQAFLDILEKDVGAYHSMLLTYKVFQDQLIEAAGQDRQTLLAREQRLRPEEARRRADFLFEGKGQAKQAARFLRGRPAPSGTVYVDDPSEPLRVNVEGLRGRLVIFSKGKMVVERATLDDPKIDLLVCISDQEIRLTQGAEQVAIVSPKGRYRGSGTSFQGGLVLGDLPTREAIDRTLKGVLTRLPSIQTSPNGSLRPPPSPVAVHVAIGPAALYRRSAR
jgi:hypothetical protein